MKPLAPSILLSFFIALLADRPACADAPPSAENAKAVALVKQLGDRSFRVRNRAADKLLEMGQAARAALEEGARARDLEVRKRCNDLLIEISQAALRARIEAFRADREGKKEHGLPGWKLYREMVGNDEAARSFFLEICLANLPLLESFEKNPKQAGAACAERLKQLQTAMQGRGNNGVGLGEIAPFFLVLADPRAAVQPTPTYMLTSMLWQQTPRQVLSAPEPSPFKKLVLGWMSRQTDDHALGHVLDLAIYMNLKEGADIALKVVREKKGGSQGRAHALVVLAKHGGKKHIALLESNLEDKSNVSSFGIGNRLRGATQVRDVALAMLVHLTEQKHTDYDFTFSRENNSLLFHAAFLGFSDDKERTAAFKKWNDWKAKQKK